MRRRAAVAAARLPILVTAETMSVTTKRRSIIAAYGGEIVHCTEGKRSHGTVHKTNRQRKLSLLYEPLGPCFLYAACKRLRYAHKGDGPPGNLKINLIQVGDYAIFVTGVGTGSFPGRRLDTSKKTVRQINQPSGESSHLD